MIYNSKHDHFRNATGLVLNYDDKPHIEETIESIKENNRLFQDFDHVSDDFKFLFLVYQHSRWVLYTYS